MATIPRAAEHAVLPRFSQRIPLLLLAGVTLAAAAAIGLFQVQQTSHSATIGYELRSLDGERATLAAEVRLLEAAIAQISRVEQIRQEAVERLGMVPAGERLRIAVTVPAPQVIPMPERYVAATPLVETSSAGRWEQILRRLPGFH